MHGLQACLFKYIAFAAFCIYAQGGEDAAKREVSVSKGAKIRNRCNQGHALNSHGNNIAYHGKSWKNHGVVLLNFCGNPWSLCLR